jgi:hypothetical protein
VVGNGEILKQPEYIHTTPRLLAAVYRVRDELPSYLIVIFCRGRTYPFFEDIISYPYPGP